MDAATRAELAALRLRAYGPDADIAADPAAIERLIELEARALQDQHVMVDSARALAPVEPDSGVADWPRGAIGHPPTDPDALGQDEPGGLEQGFPRSADPGRAGAPRRRTIAVGIAAVIALSSRHQNPMRWSRVIARGCAPSAMSS